MVTMLWLRRYGNGELLCCYVLPHAGHFLRRDRQRSTRIIHRCAALYLNGNRGFCAEENDIDKLLRVNGGPSACRRVKGER